MRYRKQFYLKNHAPCLVRSAGGEDAQAVLDCFLLTHEQTDFLSSYRDETSFDAAFERSFLQELAASEREVYLCAVLDGRIVGIASVMGLGSGKVSHRAELGVAIDKAFWGMGIGWALTEACIQCAREAGYSQLELEVVGDNTGAISLYERMGFVEWGRNPRGFRSRFQPYQELVSMRLELDEGASM